MNSILIPESLLHEKTYNADKYFNERFPSDYATMEANPNYSESGCGIAVTASDTENTLSIKDPADSSKELCKLTYSNGSLKFTYKKPAMVNNITMVGVGSTEKLNILEDNFDILHLNVVKKMGGAHVPNTLIGNLDSVCYGNGKFVGVDDSDDTFAYSTDGITWTEDALPGSVAWYSICYANNKFVAVGHGNTFAYSTDGITWTQGNMPSKQIWFSVCYGNGKFVVVVNKSNVFAYSTDGTTWTQGTMPSTQNSISVCYGNGKFVAISISSNVFAYSTDGTTWTQGTMPSTQNWISICYGNDKFVAVTSNSNVFAYSNDGINWTEGNMSDSSEWRSVCYGNGKFVAVAYQDASIMFAYSHDGYKWYTVANDPSVYVNGVRNDYTSVCYSPDHNFFVTVSSPAIISIPDAYAGGVCNTFAVEYSWSGSIPSGVTLPNPTSYTSGATVTVDTRYTSSSIELPSVTVSYPTVPSNKSWIVYYGNNKWVAVDTSTNNSTVLISMDGITWTQNTKSLPIRAYSICYGSGKFVVFSSTQNYVYSTDGINWTSNTLPNSKYYKSLCYGNGKFMALSSDTTTTIYSTDGITWTSKATSLTISGTYNSGCYGNGKFVFIGEGSKQAIYSTDGITWKTATLPSQSSWEGICYGNGKFVASAQVNDYCAYSTDGITWTNAKIERLTGDYGKDSAWSCAYGSGLFIINSYNCNAYWLSTDGINWTRHEFDGTDDWYYVQYGNGKFIIATSSGLQGKFACLTVPNNYYQFSGCNKSGTFNITSDTSITGRWTQKSKLSVTYSWTNAPTGMTSTVPAKVTGLMPNETVAVDSTYTNKSAYKDTTNKKYYKFSGWNKSGEFNITSNTSISGSWDNGTDCPSMVDFGKMSVGDTFFLGKYQVESETPWDIEWEIVHQTADYQIAITTKIIDFRAFDAKESSNTDSGRKKYGNNNWSVSNIKQFLNSDQANWYSAQHTYDAPPSSANVLHYDNGTTYNAYDTHKGFLYYWPDSDKSILKDYTFTLANNTDTDGGGSYTWTGKVFLPTYTQYYGDPNNSINEGEWFTKFKTTDGRKISSIHEKCIKYNEYAKLQNYTTNTTSEVFFLLSTASASGSSNLRIANINGIGGGIDGANTSKYGIIPCICIPRTGSFGVPSDLNYVD